MLFKFLVEFSNVLFCFSDFVGCSCVYCMSAIPSPSSWRTRVGWPVPATLPFWTFNPRPSTNAPPSSLVPGWTWRMCWRCTRNTPLRRLELGPLTPFFSDSSDVQYRVFHPFLLYLRHIFNASFLVFLCVDVLMNACVCAFPVLFFL